jgi:hypothetical protein
MARVTYKGDHAAVFVVVDGAPTVEAKWGEAVEVPAALARDLLDCPVWHPADDDKAAKPAKGKAAKQDDPANHAEKEG